jgi:ABC-type lipoprotein release transport system permease subunit
MGQLWMIALRNLAQHRRRTLMLGGAIAGVTTLLVLLNCLSTGVRATMLESATTLATGHLNIGGFYKVTSGQSAPLVTDYKKIRDIASKTLPDLDYIAPRGRGWARLVSDQGSRQVAIAGIDILHEPGLKKVLKLKEGNLDDLAKPGTVLIFADQAKKLQVKTGDSLVFSVLTPRGVNNTVDVRVAAVAEDMGLMSSWNVFAPEETVRRLYQLNEDSTGALLVYLKDMKHIPRDIDLLRKALSQAGYTVMDRASKPFWLKLQEVNREEWTGQKLDLTSWEDEMTFFMWTLAAIDGIRYILTLVLLVIIAVGVMNSMWIAIRERTREVGTLRAIGMPRTKVMAMFVLESFSLAAIATFLGACVGCLCAALLNLARLPVPAAAQFFLMSNTLKFSFETGRIFGEAFTITLATTLVSLIPSLKAARMRPVTAMQHVG